MWRAVTLSAISQGKHRQCLNINRSLRLSEPKGAHVVLLQPRRVYLHMTTHNQKLAAATIDWLSGFNPYCATTIHLLDAPIPSQLTDAGRARQIDWMKAEVAKLALRLDQTYFKTRHIGSRVARHDRFDAVCVIEKLGIHPHVHLAWVHGRDRTVPVSPVEEMLRLCCILETFNRGTKKLEERDRELLQNFRHRRTSFKPTAVANWQAKGWSVFSSSINEPFWIRYMLKEMKSVRDFTDQIFFLSELFSGQQRTEATRYHSIDERTGACLLDLDGNLVPKR